MTDDKQQFKVGRVAFRREGKWWTALFAREGTMANAIALGRIRLVYAEADPEIKQAFIDLHCRIVGKAIEAVHGKEPAWADPEPAPEHERAGQA